ncbi:sialate O-acetylesterase [Pedobacter sp. BS3]|uniref:sialate O-acetylesterase n=1 Tax=Pedobacter sp. BS3 TaxID=2567937 RepID=UPI0011EFB973|nr:sialate O-acetylesterase [Pedobacter sp. BS3]TZF83005.1 sialate O-acetylesterase [Pedobacter sp. BS3]
MKPRISLLLVLIAAFSIRVQANVTLPAIFSDGMVLQQQSDVALWGKSDAGKSVTVTTSWNNKTYQVNPAKGGRWKVKVKTPAAGGPYTVRISDGSEIVLSDVLIGEVWLASGQSNMEMPLKGFKNQPVANSEQVISASENPQIRFFNVENVSWKKPLTGCQGSWKKASPANTSNFSATAYFYAKALQEKLKVPVGIVESDWGGTRVQAWMSADALKAFPEVKVAAEANTAFKDKNEATGLFNGMINPILGYGIKGAIWYQGEQNRNEPELYGRLFPSMVKQWRQDWGIGKFPFYYVQIAPYISGTATLSASLKKLEPFVPVLREAQLQAENKIPNSGMAVLTDIGAQNTIHPPDKESVGKRLSYLALAKTYGQKDVAYSGPVYKKMKIEGNSILLKFDHAEGLKFNNGQSGNFEVAGSDKVFHPAKAEITKDGIKVSSAQVNKPVAARYAFKAWVKGDLFNQDGLPASSFRTDSWPVK